MGLLELLCVLLLTFFSFCYGDTVCGFTTEYLDLMSYHYAELHYVQVHICKVVFCRIRTEAYPGYLPRVLPYKELL